MERPVIVWIRDADFRTHDNPALSFAAETNQPILVVYIHDHLYRGASASGAASAVWLEKNLQQFPVILQAHGFSWTLRRGAPFDVLQQLVREYRPTHLMWNRRYDPDGIATDKEIKEFFKSEGVSVQTFQGSVLVEPFTFFNKTKKPYQVFTQFWKSLLATGFDTREISFKKAQKPFHLPVDTLHPSDLGLSPKHLDWPQEILSSWSPGEEHALKAVDQFISTELNNYHALRDIPGKKGTSRLSPHLHFGEVSVRTVWNRVCEASRKIENTSSPAFESAKETFLREIGWREFAIHLLYHFPDTVSSPLRKEFDNFPYRSDNRELIAWQKGKTGIPIVDAGMRQLWATGWIHNRVRMIVGSFLVKQLLHTWKEGANWFWDTLLDADLASNTLGWQWVAGSGADAAPYFRIFNPVLQGEKFDPNGDYVKKYVPELREVPPQFIHKPWEASSADLRSWGIDLGRTYPKPIVDLLMSRKRALDAFSTIGSAKEGMKEHEFLK